MAAFALTIFTGAFLLFQVQPLIGKYILPWFGGGPGVWTTCMLFFQLLLLGGYAYAHLIARCFKPRTQAIVHLTLLAAALALLPITPRDSWKPHGAGNPTLQILLLLAANLGLPYFVLSTTGPLMQHWFSRARPGASPYRLYALSNVGSLLALLSYPFFFETHFTRKTQAGMWGWGLVAYVVCCAFCAIRLMKTEGAQASSEVPTTAEGTTPASDATVSPRRSRSVALLWLLLPFCASVLLLAVTNKLCQDVAVIPFLWIAPLALYLLTFIICFDSPRWYARLPYTFALIAALAGLCWALFNGSDLGLPKQLALYCGGLFVCCMVCHGELYRLRPEASSLTAFYLMIAAGGAMGGIFVAVAAPALFTDYYELNWGIWLCGALFFVACVADRSEGTRWNWLAGLLTLAVFVTLDWGLAHLIDQPKAATRTLLTGLRIGMWTVLAALVVSWVVRRKFKHFRHPRFVVCAWLFLGLIPLTIVLAKQARESNGERVFRCRNFYGVLTVYEYEKQDPESHYYLLQHGRITHGLQFTDPARANTPVSYYGPDSGIGIGVSALKLGPRRIGVVGLGTGSMAAFARPGDYVRFYEINPQVQSVAKAWFTYLPKCPGTVEVAPGDARLTLEQEPPQRFDLLVLDAFSSDAIPVHLLTEEAFKVYEKHLSTNAIIAIHVSNHYLDLEPVVVNLARHFGYSFATLDYEENDEDWWFYSSTWMLLSRNEHIINSAPIKYAASAATTNSVSVPLWTDDFASLFQILRQDGGDK